MVYLKCSPSITAPSSTIIRLLLPLPPHSISGCLPLGCRCALRGIRCPTDHAIPLRTHQTMTAQALLGQTYTSHADLWAGLDERRPVLNQHFPSQALAHKAPLEAYPHAMHSGCMDRPEWEEDLLSLERVWTSLRSCRWFRRIRTNGFFCLGGSSYSPLQAGSPSGSGGSLGC